MFMREIVERKGVKMVCTSEEQLKLFIAAGYEKVKAESDEVEEDAPEDEVIPEDEVAPEQQEDKPRRSRKTN